MLLYPATIPAIPKTSKNQGSVANHSSSQLPIRKPTTTDKPSSKPMELYMTHLGPDLCSCVILRGCFEMYRFLIN